VAADLNPASAEAAAKEAAGLSNAEMAFACELNLTSRESIRSALEARRFGLAAWTSSSTPPRSIRRRSPGTPAEVVWGQALSINVTSNHVLAQEAAAI
jgi:hypothetical protein